MSVIGAAMKKNPPVYEPNSTLQMQHVLNNNGILLDDLYTIYWSLLHLSPQECSKLALVELDQQIPYWSSMIFPKSRQYLLEPLNVVIAERHDAMEKLNVLNELNKDCFDNLFPSPHTEVSYAPLPFHTLNACFVVIAILLFVSCLVFLIEFLYFKTCHTQPIRTQIHIKLLLNVDDLFYQDNQAIILERYADFIQLLHDSKVNN
jgi:hypothetical protein